MCFGRAITQTSLILDLLYLRELVLDSRVHRYTRPGSPDLGGTPGPVWVVRYFSTTLVQDFSTTRAPSEDEWVPDTVGEVT